MGQRETSLRYILGMYVKSFLRFYRTMEPGNRKKGLLDEASAMRFTLCHCDEVVLISFTAFKNKGLALAFSLIKVKTFCHILTCALEVKIKIKTDSIRTLMSLTLFLYFFIILIFFYIISKS